MTQQDWTNQAQRMYHGRLPNQLIFYFPKGKPHQQMDGKMVRSMSAQWIVRHEEEESVLQEGYFFLNFFCLELK